MSAKNLRRWLEGCGSEGVPERKFFIEAPAKKIYLADPALDRSARQE